MHVTYWTTEVQTLLLHVDGLGLILHWTVTGIIDSLPTRPMLEH